MPNLIRAIAIANQAHAKDIDKAGEPYILHPLRVMLSVAGEEARIVAVLHDVVEDHRHEWTMDRLRAEGFSEAVISGLQAVSKLPHEEDPPGADPASKLERYMSFIRRAGADPIGRVVKIADLRDNMDLSRLSEVTEKDLRRTEKYRQALALLGA